MTQPDEKVAEKYCINCKWMFPDRNGITELHECRSPKNPSATNLVDGSQTHKLIYCVTHRNSDGSSKGYCTPAGNWYEESVIVIQPIEQMSAKNLEEMSHAEFVSAMSKIGMQKTMNVGGDGSGGGGGDTVR